MKIERTLITPEFAKSLLETSPGNRSLRKHRVEALKDAMLRGEFYENGDTICLYEDGSLQDGHHRLTACVESGVSFYALVVFGISKSAALTKDLGAPRTNKDNLTFLEQMKPEDAGIIDGMARHLIVHDAGWESWPAPSGTAMKLVTPMRVSEWLKENRAQAYESMEFSKKVVRRGNRMCPKRSVAAIHALGCRVDRELTEQFLGQVFLGHDVRPGSTEDHLRTILLSVAMGSRKMIPKIRLLTIAKSLRSVLAGRGIKHLGNMTYSPARDSVPFFPSEKPEGWTDKC